MKTIHLFLKLRSAAIVRGWLSALVALLVFAIPPVATDSDDLARRSLASSFTSTIQVADIRPSGKMSSTTG